MTVNLPTVAISQQLAKEIRYVFAGGDQVAKSWRIVALPRDWDTDPWSKLEPNEQPSEWKDGRLPILVLPEQPDYLNAKLGAWLKAHLTERRNIPRYLLPRCEDGNIFLDPSLGGVRPRGDDCRDLERLMAPNTVSWRENSAANCTRRSASATTALLSCTGGTSTNRPEQSSASRA